MSDETPSNCNAYELFNESLVREISRRDLDAFANIVNLFKKESKKYLAQMEQQIRDQDASGLRETAHSFKGMISFLS